MTTDSPPSPESEPPSLPDEVWDRFLADSERDIRATAPKEPSARARIVARRLREEDERRAERAPRRGPGTSGRTEPVERRERIRTVVALLAMALLTVVLFAPHQAWSLVTGKGWHSAPAPTTQDPRGGQPPTAPASPSASAPPASARPRLDAAPAAPGLTYPGAGRTIALTIAPAYPLQEAPRPR